MSEWMPIETAPKELQIQIGANNYGQRILACSKGEEPYVCRWWWAEDVERSNFIRDGGMAKHPEYWQPLPAPPKENNHAEGADQ